MSGIELNFIKNQKQSPPLKGNIVYPTVNSTSTPTPENMVSMSGSLARSSDIDNITEPIENWKDSVKNSMAEDDFGAGPLQWVAHFQNTVCAFFDKHSKLVRHLLLTLLVAAFHVYLAFAMMHDFSRSLVVLVPTIIVWIAIIYYCIIVPLIANRFCSQTNILYKSIIVFSRSIAIRVILWILILTALIGFLLWDTADSRERLTGLSGMAFFILFMFVFSKNPAKIKWRPVLLGFLLQFAIGLIVLKWNRSAYVFHKFANATLDFLHFSRNGTDFVYGFLSTPPNICGMEPVFAFQPIQVVIYFGSVVALLYYLGVMQRVLRKMTWLVQLTLGTTATESLNACACIFLGQSEAPLLIRPYLERMTASELHAVMTTGFSCIAGTVFATYISLGACPNYLLSATLMSAPGSLACAKLLYPETEHSQLVNVEDIELPEQKETSALECISNGAMMAAELVIAIVANLIVFLAILAFLDACIGYFGELVGQSNWSFEFLLGFIFYPLAYIMGVTESNEQTFLVAQLMGTKTSLNELIAYRKLGQLVRQNKLSGRAAMIATYALCGFSNFCSIGIQLGVLGGMAPSRKQLLSRLVLRALLAGSISCFMTASLAGILVDNTEVCLPHASEKCFDLDVMFAFIEKYHLISSTTTATISTTLTP